VDLKERVAWRNFQTNPCPETAMAWATVHARTIDIPNELPLSEVKGIGGRAKTILSAVGGNTWEKLCQMYTIQLAALAGIGPAHRNKVTGVLAANDIKLAKEPKTPEAWKALLDSIPEEYYRRYSYYFINRVLRENGLSGPDAYWRASP